LAGIGGEDRLQVADVAETPSIGQRAARIHGAGDRVRKVVPRLVDTRDALALRGAPVMRPPAARLVHTLPITFFSSLLTNRSHNRPQNVSSPRIST